MATVPVPRTDSAAVVNPNDLLMILSQQGGLPVSQKISDVLAAATHADFLVHDVALTGTAVSAPDYFVFSDESHGGDPNTKITAANLRKYMQVAGVVTKNIAGAVSTVTLTVSEVSTRTLRITGARTGNGTLVYPTTMTGYFLLDNDTTGDFVLKARSSGEEDSGAVTLKTGVNLLTHNGRNLKVLASDELAKATQAQAEAGTDNTAYMTPKVTADAIDAQAVTPADMANRWLARFAALGASAVPASHLQPGEIGLYAADGTTIYVSGDIASIGTIYIPKTAAVYGADAGSPVTPLGAYGVFRMGDDLLANPGSSVIVSLTQRGTTAAVRFQADLVEAHGTTGYKLSQITHLGGSHTPSQLGVSWNVVVARNSWVGVKDILDARTQLVFRSDLEGHETDQFASYDNALFGANYFPGSWCLFTGSTQPTDDTNAVRQPDITSGNYVLVWGDLRSDSNPNAGFTLQVLDADQWPSGRVVHVSPWAPFSQAGHLRITLTTAAAKVGSGNTERLWARVSVVEVGDLPIGSDYYRWSENHPSTLAIDLPPEAIPNAPWANLADATILDDPVAESTQILVRGTGNDLEYIPLSHLRRHLGNSYDFTGFTYRGTAQPNTIAAGDVWRVGVNTQYRMRLPAEDAGDFEARWKAGNLFELYKDASNYTFGVITGNGKLSGDHIVNFLSIYTVGTVASGDSVTLRIYTDTADVVLPYFTAAGTNAKGGSTVIPMRYTEGTAVYFRNTTANTGNVTLNINLLGAKKLLSADGSEIAAGGLAAGTTYQALYDGTDFRLVGGGGAPAAPLSADTILDLAKATRVTADRGKALGVSATDENALALLPLGGGVALPDQSGHAGQFLHTDGTTTDWREPIFSSAVVNDATYTGFAYEASSDDLDQNEIAWTNDEVMLRVDSANLAGVKARFRPQTDVTVWKDASNYATFTIVQVGFNGTDEFVASAAANVSVTGAISDGDSVSLQLKTPGPDLRQSVRASGTAGADEVVSEAGIRAAVDATLSLGKLSKSVAGSGNVTLTLVEATRPVIEFTGARTGNGVVTFPVAAAGARIVENDTTGSYTLRAKVTGQEDYEAVTLNAGRNVLIHDGATIANAENSREAGAYDSSALTLSGSVAVSDTDAIPMPSLNVPGLIVSEDISGFGTVYRIVGNFTSLPITMKGDPNLGVALHIRYSTVKPTGTSDAKAFGTSLANQGGENLLTVTGTLTNPTVGTYVFFALSGGGTRTIASREARFGPNATFTDLQRRGWFPRTLRRFHNPDVGSADEAIAQGLHEDDLLTIYASGTDTSNNDHEDGATVRFGDIVGTERLLLGPSGNQGLILSASNTTLNGRRNASALTSCKSWVYVEPRVFDDVDLV